MKRNESNADRMLRVVLGGVFFIASLMLSGVWAMVATVLGIVMLATAVVGFCPLYTLVGLNTCPAEQRA